MCMGIAFKFSSFHTSCMVAAQQQLFGIWTREDMQQDLLLHACTYKSLPADYLQDGRAEAQQADKVNVSKSNQEQGSKAASNQHTRCSGDASYQHLLGSSSSSSTSGNSPASLSHLWLSERRMAASSRRLGLNDAHSVAPSSCDHDLDVDRVRHSYSHITACTWSSPVLAHATYSCKSCVTQSILEIAHLAAAAYLVSEEWDQWDLDAQRDSDENMDHGPHEDSAPRAAPGPNGQHDHEEGDPEAQGPPEQR